MFLLWPVGGMTALAKTVNGAHLSSVPSAVLLNLFLSHTVCFNHVLYCDIMLSNTQKEVVIMSTKTKLILK